MWEDLDVDDHELRELRDWAERLAAVCDADQRAIGRAILMLLAQIEALQAELDAASRPATQHHPGAQHPLPITSTSGAEGDTGDGRDDGILPELPEVGSMRPDKPHPAAGADPLTLRERLRRAARRSPESR
jgi:hypothetical protein